MCAMHPLRVVLSVTLFSAFHRFLCILPKLFKPTPSQLGKEHIYVFAAIYPWQACWLHPFSITWNTLCLISLSVPQVSQDLCAWPICQCSIMGTLHWTVCWNGGQFDQHFQGHMQTERPPPTPLIFSASGKIQHTRTTWESPPSGLPQSTMLPTASNCLCPWRTHM